VFGSKIIIYPIETLPLEWKVERTYADIIWLKEYLIKSFPGHFVACLVKVGASIK